jgi:6-phosphogluconolactonase (cycloisomerase 2 family)
LSQNVSAYAIDASTGALTEIAGSPLSTGLGVSASFDPTGKFVYTLNSQANNIVAYALNAATGVLTEIASSPFPAGERPIAIATIRVKQ